MTISIKIISVKDLKEKPNQERVWDEVSELWESFRVKPIPIAEEFLQDKKGKILDLGCGSGRNMIAGEGKTYYEVDFSEKQLKVGKTKAEKGKIDAEFFKLKADKLPFEDGFFDWGIFIAALHCIEDEGERLNALKELYRVLKKDAEAMITVWDAGEGRFSGKGKEVYMEWKVNDTPHMRYYYLYDKEEIVDLLKQVGFEILEIYEPREKDRFSRKNLILRVKK
jgi:ubiquinone/menaquinone biosynthesis C-methylase UbiE